ncbi:RNA polymerase sigma factor [Pyxidicoccus fallax]|uniref:RNA polymerase sigma factor n=1 Tax=Pyxidicoccus fallax TaxID=394095 RepID=A0A848LI03_9BACT|nr:RNA polymerase sigma factor [Pyxidicoccus fallax]NMO16918.1 RNA polymerase sigma factor [Pyxidicoccus fallax]NPC80425.1 RNA polymerase sigma factor [Pyxidicoccus fallax]
MTVEEAYQAYFPRIREKCRRMMQNTGDAEDVAQETFVRLWQAGLQDAPPRRVVGWVYRTSTRLAIDRMRRRRAAAEFSCEETLLRLATAVPLEREVAQREALARLVGQLPADELEAVFLHRLDRLTQPELAEVLQISERTVRRLLSRFEERLEKLREGVA